MSTPGTYPARRGFTLVETLCALLITSIAVLAIIALYQSHQDTHAVNTKRMALQAELRKAMAVIASHIRSAGFDPSDYAGAGIVIAAADYIYFTRDLNRNRELNGGADEDPAEHIAFCRYLSRGRNAIGMHSGGINGGSCGGSGSNAADSPGSLTGNNYHQPLAEEIDELSFRYFNLDSGGNWQEIAADPGRVTDPKAIHRIDVSLAGAFTYKGRQIRRQLTESVLLRSNAL